MREKLWTYLHEEHGLSLLESELNDIETIVYADLRKLAENLKDTSQEEDFKEYVLYRIEQLLDGGE